MQSENLFKLTNPQQSIWDIEQFYKNTSVNNIGGTLIIKDIINFDLLEMAINKFIEINDNYSIRLCFDDSGIVKQSFSNFNFQRLNLIFLDSYNQLLKKEKELVSIPFSLINAPLYNFTMFKFPDGTGGIIMIVHHLISDAFSSNLAANKIAEIYNDLLKKDIKNYPYYSYKTYIATELQYINSSKFEKDKKFWSDVFDTIPEPTSLSISNSSDINSLDIIDSSRQTFNIDENLLTKIKDFCLSKKVSMYNFFMAIYSLYIGKVNNVNDVILGTPILNRTSFAEKNTNGMFINTLPFRCVFSKDITFKSYLKDVSVKSLSLLRHQRYSYQYILDDIRKKNINFPNLYNILLSYQIGKSASDTTDFDYTVRWTHSSTNSDELDIHIFEYDNVNSLLNIAYDYQNKKFSHEEIQRLHYRICYIIEQVLYNNSVKLSNIELIIPDERNFILNSYNSSSNKKITKTIIDLFETQVANTPYNIAISNNGYSINYKNFNNMINLMALQFKELGISKGDNICLFFNNSIELVTCIYALLKISACYIPIDTSYPNSRINYILENSKSKFILTNSKSFSKLNTSSNNTIIIDLADIISNSNNNDFSNFEEKPSKDELAYIIYTSGSTGKPKGVQICHESLSNYIQWSKDTYVKNEVTNFPLYSSIAFDLTVTSIYTPLITGNTLYIYENSNPQLLLKQILDDKKVHILKLTPAHLSLLQDIVKNTCITKLIVGGDILTTESCKKIKEIFNNDVFIFNEYGPTEATVGCMTHIYSRDDEEYASVPIGIPANNTQIFILNDDLNLVPFRI